MDGRIAFSGVYDPKTKQLLAYPSSEVDNPVRMATLKDGTTISGEANNIALRNGGHREVNKVLSSLTGHAGENVNNVDFTLFLKAVGYLHVEWLSRSVSGPNPAFKGNVVPKNFQSEI